MNDNLEQQFLKKVTENIIPEQFTVKAHPALFEGRGGGEPTN